MQRNPVHDWKSGVLFALGLIAVALGLVAAKPAKGRISAVLSPRTRSSSAPTSPAERGGSGTHSAAQGWGYFAAVMAVWVTICAWTVSSLMTVPGSLAAVAASVPPRVSAKAQAQRPVRHARAAP